MNMIRMTIAVLNMYPSSSELFRHALDVGVPEPLPEQDLFEWAQEYLMQFTGEGPAYAQFRANYEVMVSACPTRSDLVGISAYAEG